MAEKNAGRDVNCKDLSAFMGYLNQLRKADDLIVVSLNNELPTKSFPGCNKTKEICDRFRNQLDALVSARKELITRCEAELQPLAENDILMRRVFRAVRNEADVDAIVTERSRKAVHERCDRVIFFLDLNKRVFNHTPGECRRLEGIEHGSEDIAIIENLGLGFITSGIFYMTPRKVTGEIFLFDFNNPEKKPEKLKIIDLPDREIFHPHGISHLILADGTIRLFVVSHAMPSFAHSIAILDFDQKENTLKHIRTVKDSKFIRPNDVIATGPEQFIFSNDGSAQTPLANLLEIILYQKAGGVGFYDGSKSHWVLEKTMSANGIALDRSQKYLFVSHINNKEIGVYEISKNFQHADLVKILPIGTAADNLYVDKNGAIWTGAHPITGELLTHLKDCEHLPAYSPSQVLRIEFNKDYSSAEITEPFSDDGRKISASSIAVPFGEYLFVGSVCREAILCKMTSPANF